MKAVSGSLILLGIMALVGCSSGQGIPAETSLSATHPKTVISPNGGETLILDATYLIKWDPPANVQTIRLSIYEEEPYQTLSPIHIIADVPNTGSYTWKVGTALHNPSLGTGKYRISIFNFYDSPSSNDEDRSDNPFTIAPAEG